MYRNNLSGAEFWTSPHKAITLLGMSGSGKTTLASRLPQRTWFHYSGDYRIGTRYLGEAILDNAKREAMKSPLLAELLRSDSIYLCNNITVTNLKPLSGFLGMVGDPALGGLAIDEFKRRQALHRDAEVRAMLDVREFIDKSLEIYGYPHFINDAGGSLCELDEPGVLEQLAEDTLIVYLKPSDEMLEKIIERSMEEPKPMYYRSEFLDHVLPEYLAEFSLSHPDEIVPSDLFRWIFPRLVNHRLPRYERIAEEFGVVLPADRIDEIHGETELIELICEALG